MQGIFQKENTDKALKYGIYRHLPTYEKIIRNLVSFSEEKIGHLRIDTHADNHIMQHLILKNGFEQCGIIHIADGSERIAYEKVVSVAS